MKLVYKDLKHGEIKLIPENLDDIWHLYNLIDKGDLVRSLTYRSVEQQDDKITPVFYDENNNLISDE